jgi:hypothetical protein
MQVWMTAHNFSFRSTGTPTRRREPLIHLNARSASTVPQRLTVDMSG